ncbi:MAG: zf-HC2 domain-containing protein [Dehalococcoidales bacterium]|nr:zf-HC2 domain-containing protein [Dehalococcoidales bacterium]
MKCRDLKALLSAYADDELSRTQKEFIEEHLAGCADCRATLENYRDVNRKVGSLREIPAKADLRGATMSKIKGEHDMKPVRKWLRPVLAAVPIAAILIAIAILQPWSSIPGTQTIMAKAYAATSSVQSYRFSISVSPTPDQEARLEAEYSSPDGYHVRMIEGEKIEEFIIVGDKQYVKNTSMSKNMIKATVAGFSSFLDKNTTFGLMNSLTDTQKLPDEKIDGTECLHYKGRIDMEKQIAETKRSLQESRDRMQADRPTDEEIDANLAPMNDINIEIELWICKNDNILRQMKKSQQIPGPDGQVQASSTTFKYYDFNQPVIIEPPVDTRGDLLPGWQIAGSITSDSTQPVFISQIESSIGAQPGYDDYTHQRVTYKVTIQNQSSETVNNIQVVLSAIATNAEQKPEIIEGKPENPAHIDFAPDESETYNIAWDYNSGDLSKIEIISLVNQTTITVKFTTQDGRELTQLLYPTKAPPPSMPTK